MSHAKNSKKKAIVIGAGIAGLASAIRLAVKGYEVIVFEKNAYPGGKLSSFTQDGFSFDAGPSLFTQPLNIEELFELAGEPIADYFQYESVSVACTYFFENGKKIEATSNLEQFAENMQASVGEPAANVKKYLLRSAKAYNSIGELFIKHSLHKPSTLFCKQAIAAMGATRYNYLFRSLHQLNESSFKTPEAIQLFDRYATYNGSNPYRAPGMLSLIPHLELDEGVFYPKGGMISITNALYKLAENKGVQFYFNAAVQRIIHNEGSAGGVVVNSKNYYCDIVVSNSDVYFTYKHLLNDESNANRIVKRERSSSAIVFFWGTKKMFNELGLHNILFSQDYKKEFDYLFKKSDLFSDPTVYINITSKMETGHAPEGNENWFVMINAPANTGQDWLALRAAARKQIIEKINRMLQTDIEPLIATESVLDPVAIESRTASYMGSLYGTSSNSKMAAFVRHPNFTSSIKGLYFVGGSVHPGGGIPLCLSSAKIISSMIK